MDHCTSQCHQGLFLVLSEPVGGCRKPQAEENWAHTTLWVSRISQHTRQLFQQQQSLGSEATALRHCCDYFQRPEPQTAVTSTSILKWAGSTWAGLCDRPGLCMVASGANLLVGAGVGPPVLGRTCIGKDAAIPVSTLHVGRRRVYELPQICTSARWKVPFQKNAVHSNPNLYVLDIIKKKKKVEDMQLHLRQTCKNSYHYL